MWSRACLLVSPTPPRPTPRPREARARGRALGLGPEGYRLSDAQAQAILEMRLQRLTGLEQGKIVDEYRELLERISDYLDILAKPERITAIIGQELTEVRQQYGDARRSEGVLQTEDLSLEDLITPED